MQASSPKTSKSGKKVGNLSNNFLEFKRSFSMPKITGKEAQRLLASLIDILPGTFYRCRNDKKWTMEFLSPGCLNLTGYKPEELIGNQKIAFGDLIHPEDLGSGWDKIQQAVKENKPFQHTYRIITKEGQLKWVWEQGKAVYSAEGAPIALEGIIADITEFKLNEEALRRLAKENEIIANIGRIISSSLNIEEVYERFAEETQKIIPFDRISINLIDYEKNLVNVVYTTGAKVPGRQPGDKFPLTESVNQEVAQRRSGLIIQPEDEKEISALPLPQQKPFLAGIRSQIAVPLFYQDKVIGILSFLSLKSKAYNDLDLRIAESIGLQIAGAIANAQLYLAHKKTLEALRKSEEEARRLAKENEIIANIGQIISSSLNINKIYELFAEEVHKVIPFNLIAITLIDYKNKTFCPSYLAGAYVPGRTQKDVIGLEGSFTENVAVKKSGILLQVENKKELLQHSPKLAPFWEQNFRSFIGVPLISLDVVIGVLHIYSQKSKAYSVAELHLAERIASQIAGAIANAKLYTELQQALINLQNSEERYRNLVEHSPDMILLHDFKNYVYANPAALKALGAVKEEDLIGKSVFEVIHPDYGDIINKRFADLRAGKSVPLLEQKYIRLDGQIIDVEVSASPIFYQDKALVQVVARDISERKKAEREMARLREQLQESQKLETVGRLAGGIAHDFNNLLTVIQGNCQLALLHLQEDDPLKTNLDDILRAAQRAADLTRQMLAFGRRQILALKIINLNDILRNMEKVIRRVIGEEIEIITSLDENLAKVKVDPGQIEHVLMNLSVNAKDAMPYGGKLIFSTENIDIKDDFLRANPEMSPGKYIMLTVADTGVGMPPPVKERIFEPFFTTKEMGKGTGLGLSTVYGIIKQSGGNIFVESEVGKGTTFKILLPQAEEMGEEEKTPPGEQALPQMKETILVVEDNQEVRELVVQILKKQGYVVLEAQNGQEALSLGHKFKEKIDLLLTDVVMPQISGADLAKALSFLHPEMRVLYMSEYTENEIAHQGILLPSRQLIRKPFAGEALTKKVRELLPK